MKRYMKLLDAGSAVGWFFILFSVNALVLAASLLIVEAITAVAPSGIRLTVSHRSIGRRSWRVGRTSL